MRECQWAQHKRTSAKCLEDLPAFANEFAVRQKGDRHGALDGVLLERARFDGWSRGTALFIYLKEAVRTGRYYAPVEGGPKFNRPRCKVTHLLFGDSSWRTARLLLGIGFGDRLDRLFLDGSTPRYYALKWRGPKLLVLPQEGLENAWSSPSRGRYQTIPGNHNKNTTTTNTPEGGGSALC